MSKEVVTMAGTDAMRERIAAHPWPRGGVEVIRANRGDTLYGRRTGGQVARLRPTGENDDVQILWWRGAGWATPGDFGPLIMPLNEALNFVATESFFWIGAYPSKRHEMCKLKLRDQHRSFATPFIEVPGGVPGRGRGSGASRWTPWRYDAVLEIGCPAPLRPHRVTIPASITDRSMTPDPSAASADIV